ncbi:hypothetical protein AYI68_g5177, partial [Smittium mucronatum]
MGSFTPYGLVPTVFGSNVANNCNELPDSHTISVTIFMIIGTYLSYTPQLYKIYNRRSSEGISSYFILLGSLGAISNIFNYLILHYWIIDCCSAITGTSCIIKLLGMILVFVQSIQFLSVAFLFFVFFPPELKYKTIEQLEREQLEELEEHNHGQDVGDSARSCGLSPSLNFHTPAYQEARHVAYAILFFFALCAASTYIFNAATNAGMHSSVIRNFAKLLGFFSLLVTMTQFLPQIAKTLKSRHVGS